MQQYAFVLCGSRRLRSCDQKATVWRQVKKCPLGQQLSAPRHAGYDKNGWGTPEAQQQEAKEGAVRIGDLDDSLISYLVPA